MTSSLDDDFFVSWPGIERLLPLASCLSCVIALCMRLCGFGFDWRVGNSTLLYSTHVFA